MVLLADTARDSRTGVAYVNSVIIDTMTGADTAWDNKTEAVRMTQGIHSITFYAGSATALVNGERAALPAAPYLNGNMLFPPSLRQSFSQYLSVWRRKRIVSWSVPWKVHATLIRSRWRLTVPAF